ncbi:PREDICTED: uncharacterized protein LOC104571873, partial [Tinamus guttatus]|uniref:uncharacterized protein LOC104571873 n=1 Tax=Tinamus guttatus TaxID=94827 RepID=UPI00052EFF90
RRDPHFVPPPSPAENYERLEADKKKQVQKKRKCVGPVIRYCSVTMPLITELGKEENVDVEGLDQDAQQAEAAPAPGGKCSRTFITFSDDETFERFFPKAKQPRLPVRELCPVTHKPAVYRDPITDIPYSSIRAFKIIREAYKKYITAHGLPSERPRALGAISLPAALCSQDIPISTLKDICEAMKTNTHVKKLSLVATRSNDPVANAVAEMLVENKTLQSLNIESNFITSAGMLSIIKAMHQNSTLSELKVDNQCQRLGDTVEMEVATMLEQCPSVTRFGYHFTQQGPRARAASAIPKNN